MRLQISDCRFQIGARPLGARPLGARALGARPLAAWFLAAGIVVAAHGAAVRAETIDRVLAVAANQLITLSDVTAAIDLGLQSTDGAADPVRAVLTKLIDRELVLAEVDRYAPAEPTAEQVDREVQRVRQRFPATAAFEAALARSGIDEKHLRETLRQDLRMRAYLDQRFSAARDRRPNAVEEWVTGLRQRGGVIDLYLAGR
jgi:parvulin-like peptidyl-prolyl isomerase